MSHENSMSLPIKRIAGRRWRTSWTGWQSITGATQTSSHSHTPTANLEFLINCGRKSTEACGEDANYKQNLLTVRWQRKHAWFQFDCCSFKVPSLCTCRPLLLSIDCSDYTWMSNLFSPSRWQDFGSNHSKPRRERVDVFSIVLVVNSIHRY